MISPLDQPVATSPRDDSEPGFARLPYRLDFSRENLLSSLGSPVALFRGIFEPCSSRLPDRLHFPRDFALIAWLTGRPFPEGFRARLLQAPRPLTFFRGILLSSLGSPVASFPRDFEPGSSRLPDRLHVSEGFCFHRLANRSPLLRGISSPAPRPLKSFRGILLPPLGSSVAPFPRDFEPGSPTAYIFPREFASTAWLIGRPFFEGFRARLPDRLYCSEGFCCHRSATRLPLLRGISSPAPRPLTCFRGILLSSLGSPVAPFPRDFRARHRQAL